MKLAENVRHLPAPMKTDAGAIAVAIADCATTVAACNNVSIAAQ
jgi:hypothetical protein